MSDERAENQHHHSRFFNVETYLREALDSALAQTMPEIELICVNDCSTDGSPAILKEYASKDPRVHVIDHQQNEGLLAARRTGVGAAAAPYALFLDGDDLLAPSCCETAYQLLLRSGADMLCFSHVVREYDGENEYVLLPVTEPDPIGENEDALSYIAVRRKGTTVWSKLYRTELLRTAYAALDDFYCYRGEDIYTSFVVAYFCRSMTTAATEPLYVYCRGRGVCGLSTITLEEYRRWCQMSMLCSRLRSFLERERVWDERKNIWERFTDRVMEDNFDMLVQRVAPEDVPDALKILNASWVEQLRRPELLLFLLGLFKKKSDWSEELYKAKMWLLGQVEAKDVRITELENWTGELEKARTWLLGQVEAKDARITELENWTGEREKAWDSFMQQIAARDKEDHDELRESGEKQRQRLSMLEEENMELRRALRQEIDKPWHQKLIHGSRESDYGV